MPGRGLPDPVHESKRSSRLRGSFRVWDEVGRLASSCLKHLAWGCRFLLGGRAGLSIQQNERPAERLIAKRLDLRPARNPPRLHDQCLHILTRISPGQGRKSLVQMPAAQQ